ncbi:MAG: hypothetical protein IPK26_06855 [Planctomycetes bacterium]|nr:hypothetical protein [Planctomycetota bacterium]
MGYLGLDVGGSRCRFEWLPAIPPPADAAGVQPAVVGDEATIAALAARLMGATRERTPEAAVCALAGVGERATADRLTAGLQASGIAFPVAVVGDVLAAAAGALGDGPGVLLWAGTGSFAMARGADGRLVRVGGRGFLLGDQGSGYDLVRRAAAAALLALDGLGPETALGQALVAAFGAPSVARLGAVLQRLDTGAVAQRLGVVLEVAARGDAVAQAVLEEGMQALVLLLLAAVRQAGLGDPALPVTLGGGVLVGNAALREPVVDKLRLFTSASPQLADDRAAARGAARLAMAWHRRERPLCQWVDHVAI